MIDPENRSPWLRMAKGLLDSLFQAPPCPGIRAVSRSVFQNGQPWLMAPFRAPPHLSRSEWCCPSTAGIQLFGAEKLSVTACPLPLLVIASMALYSALYPVAAPRSRARVFIAR